MAVFIAPEHEQLLKLNHLGSFDEIWQHQAAWFEAPNERRGGWSGVCRLGLKLSEGGQLGVFLKRQENHRRPTIHHRSLYPKHLFVRQVVRQREQAEPEVVVIDLEKSRIKLFSPLRTYYDLSTLNRHAKHWSQSSRLYFLSSIWA